MKYKYPGKYLDSLLTTDAHHIRDTNIGHVDMFEFLDKIKKPSLSPEMK